MNQVGVTAKPYRILVAAGEPDHLMVLLAIAVPLARAHGGQVIPLYVGNSEEKPSWFRVSEESQDAVGKPIVVKSKEIGNAILAVAKRITPDLLLLHWRGQPSRGRYLLGRTLDPVIQNAPCDVAIVRVNEKPSSFVERLDRLRRVLVPSGGGPNATLALDLALHLSSDSKVTALRIANRGLGATAVSAQRDTLRTILEHWPGEKRLQPHVVLASGVAQGIQEEAAKDYDLVLVGATRESLVDRLVFGNLPQELTREIPLPLIIVRRHDPSAAATLRRMRWRLLGILPQLTLDERIRTYRQVRRASRTSVDFYVMMTLSAAIASLGLLLNSTAVIIGAMLVAPMMSSLVGIGMGIVQGDVGLLRSSLRTALLGALIVVAVSCLAGLIMPQKRTTAEMLGRSSPTLLDLAVALVSGAAAAYAIARKDVASALPGVAVAVALVPPLASLGLAVVFGENEIALGTFLLFLTNLVAIVAAVAVIFLWMGFRPNIGEKAHARTFRGGLVGTALLLLCVTIILGVLTAESIGATSLRRKTQEALEEHVATMGSEITLGDWRVIEKGHTVRVEVSLEATRDVSDSEASMLQERLSTALGHPVSLSLIVVPVTRLAPGSPDGVAPMPTPVATVPG